MQQDGWQLRIILMDSSEDSDMKVQNFVLEKNKISRKASQIIQLFPPSQIKILKREHNDLIFISKAR